jgi:hypothetical protein
MRVFTALFFLTAAYAQNSTPNLTDINSAEARRNLEKVASRSADGLSEAELVEWTKARLAWIALNRLEGREDEALKLFSGCGKTCAHYAPDKEWKALQAWGCSKAGKIPPCRQKK